jgi:hypothetical protein
MTAALEMAVVALKAPGDTLDRLIGLNLASIQASTRDLIASGNVDRWQREMREHLLRAHTAAYIAATAERLNIPANSPLISRQRLSRAEKQDIQAAVNRQLEYLSGFVIDIRSGDMSPAAIAARANLYATSIKPFYFEQRLAGWEIPDRILPGRQTCLGNCGCVLSDVIDNGDGTGIVTRTMTKPENHCKDCPMLEGDHIVRPRAV